MAQLIPALEPYIGPAVGAVSGAIVEAVKEDVLDVVHNVDAFIADKAQQAVQRVDDFLLNSFTRGKRKFYNRLALPSNKRPKVDVKPTFTAPMMKASVTILTGADVNTPAGKQARHDVLVDPDDRSFGKMPRYGYRRRRRRRRFVTKRGAKQLIANSLSTAQGTFKYAHSSSNGIAGSFGEVLRHEVDWCYWNQLTTEWLVMARRFYSLPTQGGADEPEATQQVLKVRNLMWHMLLRSSVTDVQHVDIWYIVARTTLNRGPLTIWDSEHGQQRPASGSLDTAFVNDFVTYPSQYKEFNMNFHIIKKRSFWLQPGQTVELYQKGRAFSFTPNDYDDTYSTQMSFLQGVSQFWMIQAKGIPVHQDDGESQTLTSVNRSITGLDYTLDFSCEMGLAAPMYKFSGLENEYGTVTDAKTIIAAAPQDLAIY